MSNKDVRMYAIRRWYIRAIFDVRVSLLLLIVVGIGTSVGERM